MIEITVKMLLDENSSDTKRALAALFSLPNASCICDDPDNSEEDEQAKAQVLAILAKQKAEKTAKSETKPQPEVKAEEAKPAPQAEQKAEDSKPAEAAKKYKTEDVRAAMASKLADHRVDLVNKLKDMGAKNVSSLPEDKYEEFINFCNSL
jgi:hypothetical protein